MFFNTNDERGQFYQQSQVVQRNLNNSVVTEEDLYTPRLSSVAEEIQRQLGIIKPLTAAKDQAAYLNILFGNYSYQDWLRANQEFTLLYEYLTEYTKPRPAQQDFELQRLILQGQDVLVQANAKLQQQLDSFMLEAQNLFASEKIQQWSQLHQQLAYIDLMYQATIVIERHNQLLQEKQKISKLLASSSTTKPEREALLQRQEQINKQLAELTPAYNVANELYLRYQTQGETFNLNDYKDHFPLLQKGANNVRAALGADEENIQKFKHAAPDVYEKLREIHKDFKSKIDDIDADFSAKKQDIQEKIQELGDVPKEIAQDMLEVAQSIDKVLNYPKELLSGLNDEQRQSLRDLSDAFKNNFYSQIAAATFAIEVNEILQQCSSGIQYQIEQANLSNLANDIKTKELLESLQIITERIDGVLSPVAIADMPVAMPVVTPIIEEELSFLSLKERHKQARAIAEVIVEEVVNTTNDTDVPLAEATIVEKQMRSISDEVYDEIQSLVKNLNVFIDEIKESDSCLYKNLSTTLLAFTQSLSTEEMCQDDYEALVNLIDQAADKYPESEILQDLDGNTNLIKEMSSNSLDRKF